MINSIFRSLLFIGCTTALTAMAQEAATARPAPTSGKAGNAAFSATAPSNPGSAAAGPAAAKASTGAVPMPYMSDPLFPEFRSVTLSGDPQRWKKQVELTLALVQKYPSDTGLIGVCNMLAGYVRLPVDDDALIAKRKAYLHQEIDRLLAQSETGAAAALLLYVKTEHALRDISSGATKATNENVAQIRNNLDRLAQRAPEMEDLAGGEQAYLELLRRRDEAAYTAHLTKLTESPSPGVRTMAQGLLKRENVKQMKFTAVDGREVDLTKLRGKVVLIDFWATWCGPCIEELPNVKAAYEKYHGRGFEVIGVALEQARFSPADTPEQAAAKAAAAKKTLTDFTAKHDLPWPQYFDGKFWKTRFAVEYSVNAIPAMFLLDQEGRVVSTSARGEQLEAELRRLLKL